MRRLMAVLVALASAGCGHADQDSSGPCAPTSGLYKVTFQATSGNCGVVNDAIINADNAAGASGAGPCMGMSNEDGACVVSVDTSCPWTAGETLVSRGSVHWRHDAAGASGSLYIELRGQDGVPLCNGIYTVTYSRP
jgi:hypothetical protein